MKPPGRGILQETYLASTHHLPHSDMFSNRKAIIHLVCGGWFILAAGSAGAGQDVVRFDTEVMAVLSRAGCNAGACHGNLNGKKASAFFAGQIGGGLSG